jgi:transposase
MPSPELLRAALEPLRERPDELIEIILRQAIALEQLQEQVKQLQDQIRELNDRNNGLTSKIEALEKSAARQAAPFRIPEKHRSLDPKQPGRPKGHPGTHRSIPDHIDQQISVPLEQCPECGTTLHNQRTVVQYLEELPVMRPEVIQLITQEADCPHCRKAVRSVHPLQVSLAQGAAGVQLGPMALGVAAELNKKHGLTLRKTCAVLRQLFQLKLSPGGLSQALARLAGKLGPAYENLLARLRAGPYVHSDETSWWVGGPGHWLWVFANKDSTVYRVAEGRGRNIVVENLGVDYAGVLVSDCLNVYDEVNRHQHKCYSHHLKAISQALEAGPSSYLEELRAMLKAAMALKNVALENAQRAALRAALEGQAQRLLSTPRSGLEEKVRMRLFKQQDHLFTFLDHPEVEATNNLAERQLRPAVIARKVSCGNKTPRGARTFEVLASLAATCAQQGESFANMVRKAAVLSPTR